MKFSVCLVAINALTRLEENWVTDSCENDTVGESCAGLRIK
jgi:hypothetical protein